ncbi:MAG: hypothetical protein ACFFDW_15840 [Candidatus Thorarchaeota archaeon]
MIQAIWIITETGQCIFSHKYIRMDIEDQLISGLLTAFNAFSTESGIGGVQQIGGEDSQFVYGSAGKLMVAALADKKDNPILVEGLMNKISATFQEKYAIYLSDEMYVDLNVFSGFEDDIDNILFPKVHARGIGSIIFGIIATAALTIGTLLVLIQLPIYIPTLNQGITANLPFLIFLACVPGLIIGAVTAGTRRYALIANIIGILPIIGYFAYYSVIQAGETFDPALDIPIIILMAEQFIVIALLCAILGGAIIERNRLFPFAKGVERIDTKLDSFETFKSQEQNDFYEQSTQQSPNFYANSSFSNEQEQPELPPTPEDQQTDWNR